MEQVDNAENRPDNRVENREAQNNQFRKNLSLNSFMTIPFLALTYYDSVYLIIYVTITAGLLLYKTQNYVMPSYAVNSQVIILVLFSLTQYIRYKIADAAVNGKQAKKIIFFMISSFFIILTYVFLIRLQMYVLLAQIILGSVGIGFTVFQFFTGIWLLIIFLRKKNKP